MKTVVWISAKNPTMSQQTWWEDRGYAVIVSNNYPQLQFGWEFWEYATGAVGWVNPDAVVATFPRVTALEFFAKAGDVPLFEISGDGFLQHIVPTGEKIAFNPPITAAAQSLERRIADAIIQASEWVVEEHEKRGTINNAIYASALRCEEIAEMFYTPPRQEKYKFAWRR